MSPQPSPKPIISNQAIIIIVVGVLLIMSLIGINIWQNPRGSSDKTLLTLNMSSSSSQPSQTTPQNTESESFLDTKSNISSLPKDYKIDNKLFLQETKTAKADTNGAAKIDLAEYCKNLPKTNFSCRDGIITDMRVQTIVNYEKRTVIMILFQKAKDSQSGKQLLKGYLEELKVQQENKQLPCGVRDGLLANQDRTFFIYAYMNNGQEKQENQNETYKILDDLKKQHSMNSVFRCDQKVEVVG